MNASASLRAGGGDGLGGVQDAFCTGTLVCAFCQKWMPIQAFGFVDEDEGDGFCLMCEARGRC